MKFKLIAAVMACVASVAAGGSALAAIAYSNGAFDGLTDGDSISTPFAVSDSFTITAATQVTGINFGAWSTPGDTIYSVDWAITTQPGVYVDTPATAADFVVAPTVAPVTTDHAFLNPYGFTVGTYTFNPGRLNLAPGTYYLVLENTVASNGDPVYWDVNNGPSTASQGLTAPGGDPLGPTTSEFFQLATAPEPATWALLLSGFASLGLALRRNRRRMAISARTA